MNKINEKNELIDFEPQMLETVTLDCENDFGGFLQIVSETDSEMKNILSPVIEEGLKELVKLMPFPCYENKTRSQKLNLDNKCFQQL